MAPVLDLGAYVSLVRVLPKPTSEQMSAFADHVSRAHSWYKHLPWFPPGKGFQVFLDPAAGMQRTVTRFGEIRYSKREKSGHHYSWIPTEQYLSNFGHLAFAQSAGTSVALMSSDGRRKVPSDDEALIYNPQDEQLYRPPQEILETGASFVSGIIHPTSGRPETWSSFKVWLSLDSELVKAGLESVTAPAGKGKTTVVASAPGSAKPFKVRVNLTTVLRRAVETPERLPAWPEESGGAAKLAAIMRRLIELQEEQPSLQHHRSDDIELRELIKPEISRQKAGIANACQRVVDLVWNYDDDLARGQPRSISDKIAAFFGRWTRTR